MTNTTDISNRLDSPRLMDGRMAAALLVIGVIMGAPAIYCGYLTGDDAHLIYDHALVSRPSIAHALELFTIFHRDLYQPLPLLTLQLDFVLYGHQPGALHLLSQPTPAMGMHITNILFHAFNGVLVCWLFCRITRRRTLAFLIAVCFLIHPLATEVVAWINGRMLLTSTSCALGSLLLLDIWREKGGRWRMFFVLLLVIATMLCKIRVGLPVLMLVTIYCTGNKPGRKWWGLWGAATFVTACFLALNVFTTAQLGIIEEAEGQLGGPRVVRVIETLGWYFRLYVWPEGLSPSYPAQPLVSWSDTLAIGSLGCLALLMVALLISLRFSRVGWWGSVWYFSTLVSTLNIVGVRYILGADRYLYLPIVGLHWCAAAAFLAGVRRLRRSSAAKWATIIPWAVALPVAVVWVTLCWKTIGYYQDNIAKHARIAELYPTASSNQMRLAWDHYRIGEYESAIEHGLKELELPGSADHKALARQAIGMSYLRLEDYEQAERFLTAAVADDPTYGKSYYRLAMLYDHLGRYEEAAANYEQALGLLTEFNPAVVSFANMLKRLGRFDQAVEHYRAALETNRFEVPARIGMGDISMAQNDFSGASEWYESVLKFMPENEQARTNYAVCLAQMGQVDRAVRQYELVLEYHSGAVTAALNLAILKSRRATPEQMMEYYQRLLALYPDNEQVLVALQDFLIEHRRWDDLTAMWDRALQRRPGDTSLQAWAAWSAARAGQFARANRQAQSVLAEDPSYAMAAAAMMFAQMAENLPEQAVQSCNAIIDRPALKPCNAIDHVVAGLADFSQANPDSPWPYLLTAMLLKSQGNEQVAQAGLNAFLETCNDPNWRRKARELVSASQRPASQPQ